MTDALSHIAGLSAARTDSADLALDAALTRPSSKAMKDIFVVTHPQSQHHVDGVVGGWHDTSLTDRGRTDAQRIADRLKTLAGENAQPDLFTSDLLRAAQTAQVISGVRRLRAGRNAGSARNQLWQSGGQTAALAG